MKNLDRRIILIAMAGLPAALSGRRLPYPPPADVAASLAERVASLAGPVPTGLEGALPTTSPALLPELLQAILGARDIVELTAIARLDDRHLRERIETVIRSDFARGATALQGGWLLSRAEMAILALLTGAR